MATVTNIRNYQFLITPLLDMNVYGEVVDVSKDIDLTDFVKNNGIGNIKRDIDNGDYDIGVFTYGNITIKALNIDGKFNDQNDFRSLFPYSRDKAKVTVNYLDLDGNVLSSFKGITNEEGTRQDFRKDEVKFKVLSEDSVIRKSKISGGTVASGVPISQAIKNIISVPEITSVLTYDESKINVGTDYTIDVGGWFDNKKTKTGLDALLVASGSVMLIEGSTMVVRTREENSGNTFKFYGHGDLFGRENIINIKSYNTGVQRMFNSIVVNDVEVANNDLIATYGARQKVISFPFITNLTTNTLIAAAILAEFSAPKVELEIETTTEIAKTLNFLDAVSIDYPYRRIPVGTDYLPLYGVAKYGEARYPIIQGNMKIRPQDAFKVIGFQERPKKYTTIVKLRQRGTTISDGSFNDFISVYGSAVYGVSQYQTRID